MKKQLITTALAATTVFAFAQNAQATEVSNAETGVGIQFDKDEPNTEGPGPFQDNLAIVFSPSQFSFGLQKANANTVTYSNQVAGDQYLVVNDDRDDSKRDSGWTLSGSLSELVDTTDSSNTLASKLTFTAGTIVGYDIGTTMNGDGTDYEPNPLDSSSLGGTLPTGSNTTSAGAVTLEAGASSGTNIMYSEPTGTAGKGGYAVPITNTKLVVTSSAGKEGKEFTGKVKWSLVDSYTP